MCVCFCFRPEVLAGTAALPALPRTDKKLTEPRPFNFVSDDRAARRQQRDAAQGPSGAVAGPSAPQWKATPYDPSIFEASVRHTHTHVCTQKVHATCSI